MICSKETDDIVQANNIDAESIMSKYNITTVINSHDMNSVMEIGEKIIFLVKGTKKWEGSNKDIFSTDNQSITDFVYSSELLKKVKKSF